MLTPKELNEFAKVCRKNGIKQLTLGDVALTLDLSVQETKVDSSSQIVGDNKMPQTYTEEDILFWSSQGN